VEEAIVGGQSRILGNFTSGEAEYLSSMIRTGKLALPVEIIESKFEPAKKSLKTFWMFGLVFLLSSVLAYSISLLIKPNSKP
jgi:preprotein translocase subunit SecD